MRRHVQPNVSKTFTQVTLGIVVYVQPLAYSAIREPEMKMLDVAFAVEDLDDALESAAENTLVRSAPHSSLSKYNEKPGK